MGTDYALLSLFNNAPNKIQNYGKDFKDFKNLLMFPNLNSYQLSFFQQCVKQHK